ncbi:MAG: DUF4012 domain-containing protein [Anaerolineaceae bacterium]|nr:MAG: DUF4012 domain-containing protein [Anaerolineaceae bacterium]
MENLKASQSESPPVEDNNRRKRRRRRGLLGKTWRFLTKSVRWGLILSILTVVVVIVVGVQAVLIADAANQLNRSYNSTTRVVNAISSKSGTDLTLNDFERLKTSVRSLSNSLDRMDSRLNYVKRFAALNPDWAVMLDSLQISREITSATTNIISGLEPVLFYMVDGQSDETVITQISSGERVVELLSIGRGSFDRATTHLNTVRSQLDGIDLSEVSSSLLLQIRTLEDYYTQLHEINTFLIQAPGILTTVLGLEQTQNYLILAQNSDELRPSGGYISTYGWMTVRNGRIVDYAYYPTTRDTPQPPPQEFETAVPIPSWWIQYTSPIYAMWDGSWYANFPRTAEMARIYYNLGNNPSRPINGVIAIDVRGFEKILESLGSVVVPRQPEEEDGEVEFVTVNAGSFRDVIYDIRAEEGAHKDFVADMYNEIFSQWQSQSSDPRNNQELLGIILEALFQKHIMVYHESSQINNVIRFLGWSGYQQSAVGHDYLMVADANLGNKSNRSIIRRTTYDVTIHEDDTAMSRLSISYDYSDSIARDDPAVNPLFHGPIDYNNLMQIFVPPQSELLGHENFGSEPIVVHEDHHTIFISRVRIEYDTSQRYQVRYQTPVVIDEVGPYRRYRLLIQKQPGMLPEKVDVQVSLPPGTQIISMSPRPAATYTLDNLILDFRLELTSDVMLEIIFDG